MSDSEQKDVVGEVIAEDYAKRSPVKLQHMAVAEFGVLRWMSGRKVPDCELYAMPGFGRAPDLYDQPDNSEVEACYEHALKAMEGEADRLRQQLADVSHERDRLRALCDKKDQALRNMLGAFDTPIARRKITGEFPALAIESAHEALSNPPTEHQVQS